MIPAASAALSEPESAPEPVVVESEPESIPEPAAEPAQTRSVRAARALGSEGRQR